MFKNYFISAFRNLWRNMFYSIINILGLALGFAIFMLIFFYLNFEYTYDKHFPRAEQIYRVTTDMIWESGAIQQTAVSASLTAPYLKKDYPEVLAATRFKVDSEILVEQIKNGGSPSGKQFYEDIFYIDSSFFNVFNIGFLSGSPASVFFVPQSIVLSSDMAAKYFPSGKPIGKILQLNNDKQYLVQGVIENLPGNSHFDFNFLVNDMNLHEFTTTEWRDLGTYAYIVLNAQTDYLDFEKKLPGFENRHLEDYKDVMEYRVQPMLDIHLRSEKEFEAAKTFSNVALLSVAGIALVILIIAAINYMNLAVARSLTRSKEVGLRKVVGASKKSIAHQFLTESLLLTFIALFTGIVAAELILPDFRNFVKADIQLDIFNNLPQIVLLGVIVGILSGSYPAFFVTRFQPITALKGTMVSNKGGNGIRKVLVILQFMITISLLTASGVIYRQFQYISDKELGFDNDVKINIYFWDDPNGKITNNFATRLQGIPGIDRICVSDHVPGRSPWFEHFWPQGFDSHLPLRTLNVAPEYIPVFGFELLAGRNFSHEFGTDTAACIINEAAMKHFGWKPDETLGKTIKYNFSRSWDNMINAQVIGVVKDYHYQSLHQNIEPVVMTMHKKYYPIVSAVINSNDMETTIHKIEGAYNKMQYNYPFEFSFTNQDIEEMYMIDQKIGKLVLWFSLISVFIACLGLLGLTTFSLRQRTKEIGIRKVFGASFGDVLRIFSRELSILMLIASILAIPVTWLFMQEYYTNFAYHSPVSWWVFVVSVFIAFIIAHFTIGFQTYRLSRKNPVDALRYE